MKHSWNATAILTVGFILAQLIGILIISQYMIKEDGETSWATPQTFLGPVEMEWKGWDALMALLVIFAIGIPLMILVMKLGWIKLWKVWYGFAILLCLNVAFGAFMPMVFAFLVALVFTSLKLFRPSIITHNISELFVYGGLAAVFVPMLTTFGAVVLLLILSVYDFYAVIKSKFMVKMAKFQASTGAFAGFLVPYTISKKTKKKTRKTKKSVSVALLGGGDVAFPILFIGTIVGSQGVWAALLVVPFSTASLVALFMMGKKGKFYPALPFLTVGCIVGWIIVRFVTGTW